MAGTAGCGMLGDDHLRAAWWGGTGGGFEWVGEVMGAWG